MPSKHEIKIKMRAALDTADTIAKAAEKAGREMTASELATVNARLDEYTGLKADLATASDFTDEQNRDAAQVKRTLDALGAELAAPTSTVGAGRKAAAAAAWAESATQAVEAMMRGPQGQKALVSGSVDVPTMLEPSQMPTRPLTVLDLIAINPKESSGDGATFGWLRQTARPNNAAAVADGQLKPEGVGTFESVEDRFRTYAILSEELPIRYLTDFHGMTDVLRVQLGEAVLTAFEQDILTGAATGAPGGSTENVVGILNTSGIQTQGWSATVTGVDPRYETTLKASTKVQTIGLSTPTAYVLNPLDWELISLARLAKNPQNEGTEQAGRVLHGLPVVLNLGLPVGTGIVGDWREIAAVSRDKGKLDTDTGGEKFKKNLFQMRSESRFGLKVGRPNAFVKINLTAPTQ